MARKKVVSQTVTKKKLKSSKLNRKSTKAAKNTKAAATAHNARASAPRGGGIVPLRKMPTLVHLQKTPHSGGGSARPHAVKFSGPGDATNAHVDTDHGTILYQAGVRLIFWGREWVSAVPPVSVTQVVSDVQSILSGPYLDGLAQYGVSRPHLDSVLVLNTEDPPNPFDKDDAGNLVKNLIGAGVFPEPINDFIDAAYAVILPKNVAGKVLTLPPDIIGYHSNYLNYDLGDLDISYVHVAWAGNDGTRQFISLNFSHELVETLTDPDGSGWQVEPRSSNWNEICDVCSSTTILNGVAVSSYWSSQDNACIITDKDFTTYIVQWIWRPNRIEWLGWIDQDGRTWQFPRQLVMDLIRGGDQFKVDGAISGRESTVGIYYLDARHPYLATNTDGVPDDNLLALPQHAPA